MAPFEVSVGIPAYNSASTLGDVIREIQKNSQVRQVIVVDDASRDATPHLLSREEFRSVHRLRNPSTLGYGGSVKVILDEFRKMSTHPDDVIVIVHADAQTPVDEIPRFLKAYEQGEVDMVLGSRMLAGFRAQRGNRPLFKIIGDYVLTGIQNWLYGLSMSTYAIGYRALRRGALDRLPYQACDNRHNFDTEIILEAARAKLRMVEIPVRTVKSKLISSNELVGYTLRSVKTFFKYGRIRPRHHSKRR